MFVSQDIVEAGGKTVTLLPVPTFKTEGAYRSTGVTLAQIYCGFTCTVCKFKKISGPMF